MQLSFNKNAPKYMTEFAVFACHYLGLDRLRGNIEIDYKYGALEEEIYGQCWGDTSDCEIQIASKQWGKSIPRKEKLMTLAHELTHAKQYLTKNLIAKNSDEYVTRWHGKDVCYDPKTETTQPWEIEATEYEHLIYEAWVDFRS